MADFTDKLRPAEPQGPSILAQERAGSQVNVTALSQHLLSRNDFLNRQKRILAILEPLPIFCKKNQLNMARPDRYHLGLARAKALRRLSLKHGWDRDDYVMADYLMDEMGPYALQATMFLTSLREQCNDEQKAYWLPKAENWEIIGCYGQTELGHGSNVKGIECQAKWDPQTKEFIIHSPTITASKWWNGALGRTANHAIVVAQLLLPDSKTGKYRSYGPHQFIVQIRDMKTNRPLDGIVIGDIGPKYGYPGMDNGYMLFDHFRVPHAALLSKYSGVDPENGTYNKPENPAVVYGSLTFVRAQIIMHARLVLARAVTVAVRYLSIRRQFSDRDAKEPGAPEQAVLNYPTVQIRILPLLATTFALHYTGEAMYKLYWGTREQIEKTGDFSRLAEMHAASSGLKSLCTTLAADGIETCRRAMGGHGFGGGSGMIALNNEYLSKPTVEGDNWMITQQTAAYLIKRMGAVVDQPGLKPTDSVDEQFQDYLRNTRSYHTRASNLDIVGYPIELVRAFKQRASYFSYQAYQARVVEKKPWTGMMLQLHKLSRAHSESLLVSNFYDAVFADTASPPLDGATLDVLRLLFRLFALFTLDASASEFLLAKALTVDMLQHVAPAIQDLMAQVRPHAVALVDAWAIPDYVLESALGSYDGDVYNRLFHKAHKENPLNLLTFNPDWRSEEIVMGEGEENARTRLEALALGVTAKDHERAAGAVKPRL
ncbi:Peroxisomal acyl-coenzyme A oxidase 1 [Cladophialophora carrionii]|uniref:Acyl-coenzyme A oxidase n=1 Tax=Cladophialophora carrionii TaxID=86049 RepID=A0A1C1CXP9_9EURO|nr:Peroxisomal acyl-coenzyme A oxidase 1 [Cladophialophora carrionii]